MSRNRDLGKLPFETLGGTAGQLLSKASGTDYDFSWIDNYTSDVEHDVKAGQSISKGNAVYISSADGTNIIVTKADYTSESTSSKTIGLMKQSLALNGIGRVITEGLLTGTGSAPLNTGSANAGDPVWLGANGTLLFGLANKPYAPLHLVFLGIVTRVHSVNGEIFVKVQNGFELQELHNVSALTPATNDTLFYNDATKLWEAKPITTEELPLGDFTETNSNVFNLTGNFGSIFGTGLTIEMKKANSTTNGYLSYSDWIFFNSKQQPITGTGIVKSTLGTISYLTDNSTNWDTAYSDRLKWDGGSTGLDANVGRTSLGLSKWAIANYPVDASGLLRNDGSGTLSWDTTTYLTTNTLLTGLAGGQTVIGGTAVSDNLTLLSNNTGTRGKIILGTLSAYDELNDKLGIGTTNPIGKVNIVNGSTAQTGLSVTSSANANVAFSVVATNTATAVGSQPGSFINMILNPATSSATSNRALYMSTHLYSTASAAFTGNPVGGFFECRVFQAGTITRLSGGQFIGAFMPSSGVTGPVNITSVEGIQTHAFIASQTSLTGTVTNGRGIYIASPSLGTSSMTVTNSVGILCEALTNATNNTYLLLGTTTSPSGNWGIYSSTSNASYFAGNLLIGTTTNAGYKLDVNGTARFQNDVTISDTRNFIFSATTGTKIGTEAGQKLAFWNKSPIVQPTTGLTVSLTFTANTGTAVNDASTFGGYTLKQIAQALINIGILA